MYIYRIFEHNEKNKNRYHRYYTFDYMYYAAFAKHQSAKHHCESLTP